MYSPAAYPRRLDRGGHSHRILGLAPAGVYRAGCVTTTAVGSYPAFSPLPLDQGGLISVALSVTRLLSYPGVTWQLSHGARTFLELLSIRD